MDKVIRFENSEARISCFNEKPNACEFHVMININNAKLPYPKQLEEIFNAFNTIRETEAKGAIPVFKRFFLSDVSNQKEHLTARTAEVRNCAISIIQQPPLNGTKIALWAYLVTNMQVKAAENGCLEAGHGVFTHLWTASIPKQGGGSKQQTIDLLNNYVQQLGRRQCTLATNCVRTWFFVRDVDLNYQGVVDGRNDRFDKHGLTPQTHFIASTGIDGRPQDENMLVQMDAYAIKGIEKEQIQFLYAPTHLNRTCEYGVAFERGTCVDYGDRRHVFISGTASINDKGEVMHVGNIEEQCLRMWENVEVLLKEAGCSFKDVAQMIVYLRDAADYALVNQLFKGKFPEKPWIIVYASVCRPGWLIEMEAIAIKAQNTRFPSF